CLGGKDQGSLALSSEFPRHEQGEMRILARIGLPLPTPRRFSYDELVEERTIVIEVKPEQRILAPPY
ncbi:hypothetical protein NXH39_30855, partial [Klebsiella pneumoniae]|nr:hypothetical protein [Klebsiella pneumoniae]